MQYIALNSYRSSTDTGFANTWRIYQVTPADRKHILTSGIPTHDSILPTIMGIRPATRTEIRFYRHERAGSGYAPILCRDNNGN